MTEFHGYERRTVATSDVSIGDRMYYIGAGLVVPIVGIKCEGQFTYFTVRYEQYGRARRGVICRTTTGRSTIHVPLARVA